jgi:hypothetical protein
MLKASLEFESPPIGANVNEDCAHADWESVIIGVEEVISVKGARVWNRGGGEFSGHGFLEDGRRPGERGEADDKDEVAGFK